MSTESKSPITEEPLCSEIMSINDCQNALLDLQSRHNALKIAAYKLVSKDFGSSGWDETCEQAAREMRSLLSDTRDEPMAGTEGRNE